MVSILYSVCAFVCALVVYILPLRMRGVLDRKKAEDRAFLFLINWTTLFCVMDGVWGLTAGEAVMSRGLLLGCSAVFHLSAAFTPYVWMNYVRSYLGKVRHGEAYQWALLGLFGVQACLVGLSFFDQGVFYVDEAGAYHGGGRRSILFCMQYATYVLAGGASLVGWFSGGDARIQAGEAGGRRRSHRYVLMFVAAPILAGVFQLLYPDAPAYSIGYMLGSCVIYSFVVSDMLNQRIIEESVSRASDQAKTKFLFNMSHDIRTPMNAIIGFTRLATAHLDDRRRVADYLAKIGKSSDHLLNLINDVLDMSRIESGKMTLNEREEELSAIVHGLREIILPEVDAKGQKFLLEAVDISDERVKCDKLRLTQLLLNLLSNAVKYTPAGGTVALKITQLASKSEGRATYEFRVSDTGIGMSEEFAATVFEPFTREQNTTVSGIQGTGLGMAITKHIADMMGGTITLETRQGKGSEFTVTLDFEAAAAGGAELGGGGELEGTRVLVVDDDLDVCTGVAQMLKDAGLKGEWCTTGEEAARRAEEAAKTGEGYGAYLVDWQMPGLNGVETMRKIRAAVGEGTPIVVLTAYDWSDVEAEAREAGATDFLAKPLFPSDLRKVLERNFTAETGGAGEAEKDFAGARLLVVEDNEINREIAQEILQEHGCVVDTAENGRVAVEKATAAGAR